MINPHKTRSANKAVGGEATPPKKHSKKNNTKCGIGREAVHGFSLFLADQSGSSHADFWDLLHQIEVGHGKKAIVIFVPVPSLQGFHRVQQR